MAKHVSRIDEEKERLKELLEALQEELVHLVQEKKEIEKRIEKLQSDVVHLAAVCGVPLVDPITQLGLTDVVRYILSRHTGGGSNNEMLMAEIIEAMKRANYDVSGYSNINANIYTILGRLIKAGEVGCSGGLSYRYYWKSFGLAPTPPTPEWLRERLEKSGK